MPLGDLAKLRLSGLSKVDPKASRVGSQGGVLNKAAAGGGSANAQELLPRHRSTVERFFARSKGEPEK